MGRTETIKCCEIGGCLDEVDDQTCMPPNMDAGGGGGAAGACATGSPKPMMPSTPLKSVNRLGKIVSCKERRAHQASCTP
jgi:hypothetical protein